MMRVVVIGARRRYQGIGEFVARYFARSGAHLAGVVGTSRETVDAACRRLATEVGFDGGGYTDVETALERERPDIVAICSPYRFHRRHLELVASADCHCLCEKPLWWQESSDRAAETASLVDGFIRAGRYLTLLAQWPCTLQTYFRIFPRVSSEPLESFEMLLSPSSTGAKMVLDSAPHPLSILARLLGNGTVEDVGARFGDAALRELDLEFEYRHGAGKTSVRCRLVTREEPPRPAAYGINGRRVRREVVLPAYDLRLVEDREGDEAEKAASLPLEDPLRVLVMEFLRETERGAAVDREGLIASVNNLEPLFLAARRVEEEVKRTDDPRSTPFSGTFP